MGLPQYKSTKMCLCRCRAGRYRHDQPTKNSLVKSMVNYLLTSYTQLVKWGLDIPLLHH